MSARITCNSLSHVQQHAQGQAQILSYSLSQTYTPNRRYPMTYLPSFPSTLTSSLQLFMRKAALRSASLSDRFAANSLPLNSRNLGAGFPCPGTSSVPRVTPRPQAYTTSGARSTSLSGTCLFLMLFAFMYLLVGPDAFASLSQPFTTKLTTLSSQLELIGKSIVGVSVLIGIILSAAGNPQWKMIITAICVGIAIIGFNVIKEFIGLGA